MQSCLMKRFLIAAVLLLSLGSLAFASDPNDFLPQSFAGWTKSGSVQSTTAPAKADAAYPAVLQEYGFADAETVTYTRAGEPAYSVLPRQRSGGRRFRSSH